MDWIAHPESWIALTTLVLLEIVLGIDNIVFISILTGKLPDEERARARRIGLAIAMIGRIVLLLSLTWIMRLVHPLFSIWENEISGRDVILIVGGLFLIAKATHEIHAKLEGDEHHGGAGGGRSVTMRSVLVQVLLLDIVFSLDSVITAVGMADEVGVMIVAVVVAVLVMMATASSVSAFIERHPTVKMLALSFLLLIGVTLIADGLDQHIPKGYIYFAMAFSILVEMLNLRARTKSAPVDLNGTARMPEGASEP